MSRSRRKIYACVKKRKYKTILRKANDERTKANERIIQINQDSLTFGHIAQSSTAPSTSNTRPFITSEEMQLPPVNEFELKAKRDFKESSAQISTAPSTSNTRPFITSEEMQLPLVNEFKLKEKKDVKESSLSPQIMPKNYETVRVDRPPSPEAVLKEDEVPLIMEKNSNNNTEQNFAVEGRRVIDFQYFMRQLIDIERHGEQFGCRLNYLKLTQEKQKGLKSFFFYTCSMCGSRFQLNTCDDDALKLDVNAGAVSGAIMTGIGWSNLNEFNASMDLPTMSFQLYSLTHDDVAEIWRIAAEESMQKAAEEERVAAISRGDVNDAGIAMVPVEADACWSKRSYKTNYSALSGAAAIIGEHTGKVLHIGVRNRYCVICVRAKKRNLPPREHNCTKNHLGSATSMEQSILVEGFQCSVKEKQLIYNTLIADGDSSTYKSILESRPYPGVPVQKIECTNHLLRNYNGKNMQLQKDTSVPLIERKLLTVDRLTRLRTAVRSASKYRNQEIQSTENKIKNLQKDILNSIRHIFGDHAECEDYYCTPERKAEQNLVPKIPTLILKLRKTASQLAFNSRSLLHNCTNNRAEQFNSMIAKVVGGKRINYSLKDSYKARCYAAVVAFNTGKPQYTLYKTLWNKSPGLSLKRLEQKRHARNVQHTRAPKRFKKKIDFNKSDDQYGPQCQRPDMNQDDFNNAKELFLNNLKQQALNRFEIERSTILQAESALWVELRRCILTASIFSKICKRRPNQNSAPLVKVILYSYDLSHVPSIKHGKENEARAVEQLGVQENIKIEKCGLFIDDNYCFLGASPDGIYEEGLVEIKCPFPHSVLTQKRL